MSDEKYFYALLTKDGKHYTSSGYYGNETNLVAFPDKKSAEHYIRLNGGNDFFKLKRVRVR